MFDRTGWKTFQESIAIVQPGQNKSLNKELWSMFRKKGPDILDVEYSKSAGPIYP